MSRDHVTSQPPDALWCRLNAMLFALGGDSAQAVGEARDLIRSQFDEIERLRAHLGEIVRFNDECAAEPDPDTGFDPNGPLMTRARELANG